MRLLCGHDAEIGEWVAARIPHIESADDFGMFRAIGVADAEDKVIAGIVYHNYMPRHAHVEVSFAASTPKFATRGVVRALLSVPFEQYDCRRITLLVPNDGERTKRFVSGLGFIREGCLRGFFGEKRHGEIYGMTQKDYAKLRERIG